MQYYRNVNNKIIYFLLHETRIFFNFNFKMTKILKLTGNLHVTCNNFE